ncbi:hypothetical protein [Xylella taiwanensis]|uniref:hypothetical protein n=1 Tax=Xylella taiwanensis TaxID=1444770 RepID=UPI001C12FB41|nr:hypothetical protein [Xylella taiwanensis]MCD8457922.1 hypothetical protein [Xylella taiwanensis]
MAKFEGFDIFLVTVVHRSKWRYLYCCGVGCCFWCGLSAVTCATVLAILIARSELSVLWLCGAVIVTFLNAASNGGIC